MRLDMTMTTVNGAQRGNWCAFWVLLVVFALTLASGVRCHVPAHSVETDGGTLNEETTDSVSSSSRGSSSSSSSSRGRSSSSSSSSCSRSSRSSSSSDPQTLDVQCQRLVVEDEGEHTRALHAKEHQHGHDEHSDHEHQSEQYTQHHRYAHADIAEQNEQHNDGHACQDHKDECHHEHENDREHEHEHEHEHGHHHEHDHDHHHEHDHDHDNHHEHEHEHGHHHEHEHDHHHGHDHHHEHEHIHELEHHGHHHEQTYPHGQRDGHVHSHGHDHRHHHHSHGKEPPADGDEFTTFERKVYMAFSGTLAITVGGNLVILLFLNMNVIDSTLNILTSFAMGGLLGDVFLHLLPHAMGSHGHGHSHSHEHDSAHHHGHDHVTHSHDPATEDDYAQRLLATFLSPHMWDELQNGLLVLLGIIVFFVIEKILGYCSGHSVSTGEKVQRLHSHSHGQQLHKSDGPVTNTKRSPETNEPAKAADGKLKKRKCWLTNMQPGAILSLMADAAHNFTDGRSDDSLAAFRSLSIRPKISALPLPPF